MVQFIMYIATSFNELVPFFPPARLILRDGEKSSFNYVGNLVIKVHRLKYVRPSFIFLGLHCVAVLDASFFYFPPSTYFVHQLRTAVLAIGDDLMTNRW